MKRKSKILVLFSLVAAFLLIGVTIAVAGSHGSISGGGQLRENGEKQYKISFGGWLKGEEDPTGEWEVNFHNVGNDELDKTKFYTTDIRDVNYYEGNHSTCHSAFNFTAYGKLNNKPGYKLIFRGGDNGSPGKDDTVRVELYKIGQGKIYDTNSPNEFTAVSKCVGTARTGLDKGNLTIVRP